MAEVNKPKLTLTERFERIAKIEKQYGVQNLMEIILELTENPNINLSDLDTGMINAVLEVLNIDAIPHDRPEAICKLNDDLLEHTREAKKEPEIDEPFIKEISDGIAEELDEELLTFLDDEWPTYAGKE